MEKKSLFIIELSVILLIGFSSFLFLTIPNAAKIIVDIQLVLYLIVLWLNYRRNKAFNLYQIWIVSYIFIVWSEMEILSVNAFSSSLEIPFARYTLANFAFLFGYHFYKKDGLYHEKTNNIQKTNFLLPLLLIVLYVYYVGSNFLYARNVFLNGRSYGSGSALANGSLLNSLTSSLGLMLPALIGYYYTTIKHKRIWISLFFSLPIFVVLLLTTSRFKFLFSIVPFLIVTGVIGLKRTSFKKNFLLLLIAVAILVVTGYIKENRNVAFFEFEAKDLFGYQSNTGQEFFEKVAYEMSPEGVVKMASVADDYFSTHDLHYGKETGFIFIFWIPRGWWPDKPTMLDNWLIREYEHNLADGYSTASGFIGELRADFGWFCLVFILVFGLFVHRLDNFTKHLVNHRPQSFQLVLVSILYPWIFFFVRSPLTATMTLLWELLLWKIVASMFFNKKA